MKRQRALLVVVSVLLLLLCACDSTNNKRIEEPLPPINETTNDPPQDVENSAESEEFDLDAYKQKVQELNDNIVYVSIALGNMGNYASNYMQALGKPSDSAIDAAYSWLEEKSDYTRAKIEELDLTIAKQYLEIADITQGVVAEELFSSVKNLYDNYVALYCTVTTVPYSVSAFAEELSEYFSGVSNSSKQLTKFLS